MHFDYVIIYFIEILCITCVQFYFIYYAQANPNTPGTTSSGTSTANTYEITGDPQTTGSNYCLSMGAIGVAKDGSLIYNPLTSNQENAVEGDGMEAMDVCGGHSDNG